MPKISLSIHVEAELNGRFFLLVDDKPWAVFDSLEDGVDGLKTTMEILGESSVPAHENTVFNQLASASRSHPKRGPANVAGRSLR